MPQNQATINQQSNVSVAALTKTVTDAGELHLTGVYNGTQLDQTIPLPTPPFLLTFDTVGKVFQTYQVGVQATEQLVELVQSIS